MTPTDVLGNRRLSGGPLAAVRGGRGPGRRYVVMPVGGGGAWVISMARSGVQPIGGQSSQKTQIVCAVGRAALGAITPRQPSRQSASPMSWHGGQSRRLGRSGFRPTAASRSVVLRSATVSRCARRGGRGGWLRWVGARARRGSGTTRRLRCAVRRRGRGRESVRCVASGRRSARGCVRAGRSGAGRGGSIRRRRRRDRRRAPRAR